MNDTPTVARRAPRAPAMAIDEEALLARVRHEARLSFERIEPFVARAEPRNRVWPDDVSAALAEFELHGSTIRCLSNWYPQDERVNRALHDWERQNDALASAGLVR